MKYWFTILCIIIISHSLTAQQDIKINKTPVIESFQKIKKGDSRGEISLLGIKFKDTMVLCQILII